MCVSWMRAVILFGILSFSGGGGLCAAEDGNILPNPDFQTGAEQPTAWSLSGGDGQWVDGVLRVTGSGDDSNYWQTDVPLQPGALYEFAMKARSANGGGCVITGPPGLNHDYRVHDEWQWYRHVFCVPRGGEANSLRLGQWHAQGTIQFDAARLARVVPVHRRFGLIELGDGESLRGGDYEFVGVFSHAGTNYHRPLVGATASFNSNRWSLSGGQSVTYRFRLPGGRFRSGEVSLNVCYHVRGACQVEVSTDQKHWTTHTIATGLGAGAWQLPENAFPAADVFVRLKTADGNGYFQIDRLAFSAAVERTDGEPTITGDAIGKTEFARIAHPSSNLEVRQLQLEPRDQATWLWVHAQQREKGVRRAHLTGRVECADGAAVRLEKDFVQLDAARPAAFRIRLPQLAAGVNNVHLRVEAESLEPTELVLPIKVHDLYRADYGRVIAGGGDMASLWWCDATHKVPRGRALPNRASAAIAMSAAKNDVEAAQLVIAPKQRIRQLTATASSLSGPDGATIAANRIEILRVHYHFVHHPTDMSSVRDWWPDALPPLRDPRDLAEGVNQPLWIVVRVPADAAAGDYHGTVRLRGNGFESTVPLKLHVWDFALPERNHLETAFGLNSHNVFRYHQVANEKDKRAVWQKYLKILADHRISPYDPTPLDPMRVRFEPDADPPRAVLDVTRFDAAMSEVMKRFPFTGFRLRVRGMGGGTFHARSDPSIQGYAADTPQFKAMFKDYAEQLESYLKEKGWLDEAYVYWFDEPDPKDYEFVRGGCQRLKEQAPGLRIMMTEQPEEGLAGPIDIWCPVSHNYRHEAADARRAHGKRFWWYVCCGPKAPYCTLFIDHPATEMRVWLWQTWQRDLDGILVWSTNYWTSSAAFPDPARPQNPYDDPMGYTSGYSTPKGVKRYWGNGDGRFIYPPETAATPGLSGPDPVFDAPVGSIRFQMLREGIEDWEMLYLLRERIAKHRATDSGVSATELDELAKLLEVPPSITSEMTTFTTDPAPIYERRKAIAEAIERLR
jgi:hypothetical protein